MRRMILFYDKMRKKNLLKRVFVWAPPSIMQGPFRECPPSPSAIKIQSPPFLLLPFRFSLCCLAFPINNFPFFSSPNSPRVCPERTAVVEKVIDALLQAQRRRRRRSKYVVA